MGRRVVVVSNPRSAMLEYVQLLIVIGSIANGEHRQVFTALQF